MKSREIEIEIHTFFLRQMQALKKARRRIGRILVDQCRSQKIPSVISYLVNYEIIEIISMLSIALIAQCNNEEDES